MFISIFHAKLNQFIVNVSNEMYPIFLKCLAYFIKIFLIKGKFLRTIVRLEKKRIRNEHS